MKVGILSESDADEAGIRILAQAILGSPLETIAPVRIRSRGWSAVLGSLLPSVYKSLHWNPEADGLIVVVDSDDSTIHDQSHEAAGLDIADCRACRLLRLIRDLRAHVPPRPRAPLKVAIGVAVPAIEAWYQCGIDIHCTEAHFMRQTRGTLYDARRDLKRKTYGTVSPPQLLSKQKAIEHSTRLATQIDLLGRLFPNGFGLLVRSLGAWSAAENTSKG